MSTVELDRYVIETLMPDLVGHDRAPSALCVYLALTLRAQGSRGRGVTLSLRELAEGTGLSKRAVQTALARLERRKLVSVERGAVTEVPAYVVLRPWIRRKTS